MQNLKLDIVDNKDINCQGVIFKCVETTYNTSKGIANTKKLNIIRTLSCNGCSNCGWLLEDLDNYMHNNRIDISHCEHNNYYELITTNISRDWESGYIDDWDLEFVKIELSDEEKKIRKQQYFKQKKVDQNDYT